jgi:hypothetical protein
MIRNFKLQLKAMSKEINNTERIFESDANEVNLQPRKLFSLITVEESEKPIRKEFSIANGFSFKAESDSDRAIAITHEKNLQSNTLYKNQNNLKHNFNDIRTFEKNISDDEIIMKSDVEYSAKKTFIIISSEKKVTKMVHSQSSKSGFYSDNNIHISNEVKKEMQIHVIEAQPFIKPDEIVDEVKVNNSYSLDSQFRSIILKENKIHRSTIFNKKELDNKDDSLINNSVIVKRPTIIKEFKERKVCIRNSNEDNSLFKDLDKNVIIESKQIRSKLMEENNEDKMLSKMSIESLRKSKEVREMSRNKLRLTVSQRNDESQLNLSEEYNNMLVNATRKSVSEHSFNISSLEKNVELDNLSLSEIHKESEKCYKSNLMKFFNHNNKIFSEDEKSSSIKEESKQSMANKLDKKLFPNTMIIISEKEDFSEGASNYKPLILEIEKVKRSSSHKTEQPKENAIINKFNDQEVKKYEIEDTFIQKLKKSIQDEIITLKTSRSTISLMDYKVKESSYSFIELTIKNCYNQVIYINKGFTY